MVNKWINLDLRNRSTLVSAINLSTLTVPVALHPANATTSDIPGLRLKAAAQWLWRGSKLGREIYCNITHKLSSKTIIN